MKASPFVRSDRDQLIELANAHIAAVTPGASIPAATLLGQLERPFGEFSVGPWVTALATLVAIVHERVVAAAHLRRYTDDERASDSYRDTAETLWLLCWPDAIEAGRAARDAAIAQLSDWRVRRWFADGTLPVAGVFGVSDHWPHVRGPLEVADASAVFDEIMGRGVTAWSEPEVRPWGTSSSWFWTRMGTP